MNFLLHTDASVGGFMGFLESVVLDGIIDTLKIVPFLFITYLFMELLEHRGSDKIKGILTRAGSLGPLVSGLLGAVPQCGFSTVSANLYTGRIITLGSLIAVFLATSDEMIPIMISRGVSFGTLLPILLYKVCVGIAMGFAIDLTLHLMRKGKKEINIDEICENDNCRCERGIIPSALHHTLSIGLFVLMITLLINTLIFFVGEERIADILYDKPVISHLIAAVVGLLPNCAVSVALTDLAIDGFITSGTMLSGLFSGAGVGLIVLLRVNKHRKENLTIVALLVTIGCVFGLISDLIGFISLA